MSDQTSNGGNKDAKTAWSDVSERFTTWGRMVADRYREREGGDDTTTSEEAGRKLDDAARDLTQQLNRAFTALGETLRDETAKAHLKDAVRALGDAVTVTVNETADEIRKRVRSSDEGSTSPSASGSSARSETGSNEPGSTPGDPTGSGSVPPPPD